MTKNINIDATRAYELLKKAVERKGVEYVTPEVTLTNADGETYTTRGRYTHKGKSLCQVGMALSIAGVTQAEMNLRCSALALAEALPLRVNISHAAARVFMAAQNRVDKGYTWGEGLAEAYKVAPVVHSER